MPCTVSAPGSRRGAPSGCPQRGGVRRSSARERRARAVANSLVGDEGADLEQARALVIRVGGPRANERRWMGMRGVALQVDERAAERHHLSRRLPGVRVHGFVAAANRVLLFRKLVAMEARLLLGPQVANETELGEHRAILEPFVARELEGPKVLPIPGFCLAPVPVEQAREQTLGGLLLVIVRGILG